MKEDDSYYLGTRYKLSGKKGERKCGHLDLATVMDCWKTLSGSSAVFPWDPVGRKTATSVPRVEPRDR